MHNPSSNTFLDICSGLGGASAAFSDAGWDVITVDIEPRFNPDILADVNTLHLEHKGAYRVVWASPPCTDYSKFSLPASWKCNGGKHTPPDMRPFLNCVRIIRYLEPRYWIIENVRGAVPFFSLVLGPPKKHVGSRYLWGNFPDFISPHVYGKWKLSPSPDRSALRSCIPYSLSQALCAVCTYPR